MIRGLRGDFHSILPIRLLFPVLRRHAAIARPAVRKFGFTMYLYAFDCQKADTLDPALIVVAEFAVCEARVIPRAECR
jgi:hypothetical protein